MPLVIGIDSGQKSGWVVALDDEIDYYSDISLQVNNKELLAWFRDHRNAEACGIESVHARPGFNVTAQAGLVASMEKACMAADAHLDVPVFRFRPQEWQTAFGLIFKTTEKLSADKRKKLKKATHLARLNELMWFSEGVEMNVEKADSVLIALYTEYLLERKDKIDF